MTPSERLNTYIAEGRLIRHEWIGRLDDGRKAACLLATMAPECGRRQSASACPAEIMPAWLAHLTPWIDDVGSLEAWPGMVLRYAGIAARWHVLSAETWKHLRFTALRIYVEETAAHYNLDAAPAIAKVVTTFLALCRRAEIGDFPTKSEWRAADAGTEEWTWAHTAEVRMARMVWTVTNVEARTEADSDENAKAVVVAARVAGGTDPGADDRITAAVLDAIEAKIVEAEA